MGIFTYLKIGLAVVILGVCGYYVWNYHHMAAKIAAQHQEIENLKLGQQVLAEKQQKYDAFMTKATTVKKRVTHEQQEINEEVDKVDDPGLERLYDKYRLHSGDTVHPPAARRKGRTQNAAPGSP